MNPTEQKLWIETYIAIISMPTTKASTAHTHADDAVKRFRQSIEELYHHVGYSGVPE